MNRTTFGTVNYYSALESSAVNRSVNHSSKPADLVCPNYSFDNSEGTRSIGWKKIQQSESLYSL